MTIQAEWPLPTLTLTDPGNRWVSSTCRLEPGLEETRVYIGDALFAILPVGAPFPAKFAAAHLTLLGVASAEQVAQAFGFGATSVRQWIVQLQRSRTLFPGDFKRGPTGPRKVTPEIFRYMATHPARSHRDMADQIAQRFDVRLSPYTVRLYRLRMAENETASESQAAPAAWVQESFFSGEESHDDLAALLSTPTSAATEAVTEYLPEDPDPTGETSGSGFAESARPVGMESSGPVAATLPPIPQDSVAAAGFLVLAPYLAHLALSDWTTAHPWHSPHQFRPMTILLAWILAFLLGSRSAEATKLGPRA